MIGELNVAVVVGSEQPNPYRHSTGLAHVARGLLADGEGLQPCVVRTAMSVRVGIPGRRGEPVSARWELGLVGCEVLAIPAETGGGALLSLFAARPGCMS